MSLNGGLDEKDLQKKLEEILTLLMKKGLIPELSSGQIKELAKTTSDTLKNDPDIKIYPDDLQKRESLEALATTCIANLIRTKTPEFKFDPKILFKENTAENREELKLQLTSLFKEMCKLNPKFTQKNQPEDLEKNLSKMAEVIVENNLKQQSENELIAENNQLMEIVLGCLDTLSISEQRREMYGVDQAGEVFIPVNAVPYGEQIGWPDLTKQGGESFLAKRSDADPTVPDPSGTKILSIVSALADGVTSKFEDWLEKENPSYESPTLTPKA